MSRYFIARERAESLYGPSSTPTELNLLADYHTVREIRALVS